MKQVIFDSSFLMAVAETPTTWFEDMVHGVGKFQPVLPECVRKELERLASGQGRKARTARVCLEMASNFAALPCGGAQVDDEIVSAALSSGSIVATADARLAQAARGAHLRVASLRKGRLALD
ncbi:MAG TPA: hypothetical protein VEB87_02915 [Nitrososphaerales archaeon]|nr:hypothetical protein [Nitrososphaerales archaeon]